MPEPRSMTPLGRGREGGRGRVGEGGERERETNSQVKRKIFF